MASPKVQFDGGRWLVARHRSHLEADRARRADVLGALGVSAARLGRWPDARRHAAGALRAQPTNPRRWARLALATVPAAGRRTWGVAPEEPSTLPVVPRVAAELDPSDDAAGTAALDALLFLPHGYRTNPARSADAEGTPFWTPEAPTGGNDVRFQDQVYRWAARLVRTGQVGPSVVDIGCGSGHKLVRHIAPVTDGWLGVDQPSGIATASATFPDGRWLAVDLATDEAWTELDARRPDLVLCADVIEHLTDPHALLARLRTLAGPDGQVLLSTPDRSRLDDTDPLGPPRNARHIREWSHAEMELLLESAGFEIVAQRHLLPRRYSATVLEAKRTVHRALHGRMIPDRRSCMAFLLRPAP
jgi:SAM-dependent methyltransferase